MGSKFVTADPEVLFCYRGGGSTGGGAPRSSPRRSQKQYLEKHANPHTCLSPRLPHTPSSPDGHHGRPRACVATALPSPHTLTPPAPLLPPASAPPTPPLPLRGMKAHVLSACSLRAASLPPPQPLSAVPMLWERLGAVFASECGRCPGIRSPDGAVRACTQPLRRCAAAQA